MHEGSKEKWRLVSRADRAQLANRGSTLINGTIAEDVAQEREDAHDSLTIAQRGRKSRVIRNEGGLPDSQRTIYKLRWSAT